MKTLPESILTKAQKKTFTKRINEKETITCTLRYDDECKNGHNTFSITGTMTDKSIRGMDKTSCCGCIHGQIKKYFPELAHLIKWHLVSSDGPLHYVANTLYHISDKDCWGLRKGETRQFIDKKTNFPAWQLKAVHKVTGEIKDLYSIDKNVDALECPESKWKLEFRAWERIGEGKEIDLEAARESAKWYDANIEDFTKENLEKRLPDLMHDFKQVIESIGFIY